ncbi:hydroxymethylbilane synthase [Clostridium sp. LBM24168]
MKYRIATRKSRLAQIQADIVIRLLMEKCGVLGRKVLMETTGDRRLDIALDKIGGKGLFIKEIERALLEGRSDAAVHSMKDVPFDIPCKFEMAAVCEREDVRDVFVSNSGVHFEDLRPGSKIGTSSRRRSEQIKKIRGDLCIVPIRGNVQTRIKKMKEENLQGIILASAGVKRLGLEDIITDYFSVEDIVPAIGQGALGVEIKREYSDADVFRKIDDRETRICVEAERSFMRTLNGDCHSAIGAYARIEGKCMDIIGMYEIENRVLKSHISGSKSDYMELGRKLALNMLGE